MKDYLKSVVLLTFIVVLALLILHYLPTINVFGTQLRNVDLLGDIRVSNSSMDVDGTAVLIDSTTLALNLDTTNISITTIDSVTVPNVEDSVLFSEKERRFLSTRKIVKSDSLVSHSPIIDYADSTQRGMYQFYSALSHVDEPGNYARIAFFGDSFVEADILTADLRNFLQEKYGGCGVGFVPITSEMRFFRRSVKHDFKGWSSFIVTQKPFKKKHLGLGGEYFIPTSKAYVEYSGQSKFGTLLDTCSVASIYYNIEEPLEIVQRINSGVSDTLTLVEIGGVRRLEAFGNIGRVRWTVPKDSSAVFYGASFDGENGITLDNFGQRGSSGYSLSSIPFSTFQGFNDVRPYQLIILQYGLNVVAKNVNNYDYYKKGLTKVISYLKKSFPQAGFLIVSVGDRNAKGDDGNYHTMPEIESFIKVQKAIAKENNIAFWNLFEAMGGEDSMVDLVKSKPAKANLDYTHINFIGGKFLGEKLYEALVDGKNNFDNLEIYVEE